jgi:hypothetical protein
MTPARKYLLLLATLVMILVTQPLLARGSVPSQALYDAMIAVGAVGVLFAVFRPGWERQLGVALALPALASNVVHYYLPESAQALAAAVYHVSIVAFVGFAIGVILREIFARRVIGVGDILGAFAGYLLGGVAWGNLYVLAEMFVPGSFSVSPAIVWRVDEWHQRRAVFDYFSFTTLTSLGFGDITPIAPPATTLSWLEVMFGQFYMAVVVAQIVGLNLAQAVGARCAEPE